MAVLQQRLIEAEIQEAEDIRQIIEDDFDGRDESWRDDWREYQDKDLRRQEQLDEVLFRDFD